MTALAVAPPIARRRRRAALPAPLLAGGLILLASLVVAVLPHWIAPYSPTAFDYKAILKPPSWAHPFGTDNFGRDMLSRVIHAYTIDLQIAVFATLFPFLFGTTVGALVGYYGGLSEVVLGRVVDALVTFPLLVLVIAIVAVLGPGLNNMYVAFGIVYWVFYARLVAAEMALQRRLDYAAAARVMGYGDARIILRHLMPNVVTIALVYWMTDMALAILVGSSLGYLGLGVQPPAAEWGVLIAGGKNYMSTGWWISIFPGLAIVLTGLGFSLLGDGLADLLRPKR
jgi:peptide/nickel transport system permease protein